MIKKENDTTIATDDPIEPVEESPEETTVDSEQNDSATDPVATDDQGPIPPEPISDESNDLLELRKAIKEFHEVDAGKDNDAVRRLVGCSADQDKMRAFSDLCIRVKNHAGTETVDQKTICDVLQGDELERFGKFGFTLNDLVDIGNALTVVKTDM